jgi:hypothetical protein
MKMPCQEEALYPALQGMAAAYKEVLLKIPEAM